MTDLFRTEDDLEVLGVLDAYRGEPWRDTTPQHFIVGARIYTQEGQPPERVPGYWLAWICTEARELLPIYRLDLLKKMPPMWRIEAVDRLMYEGSGASPALLHMLSAHEEILEARCNRWLAMRRT